MSPRRSARRRPAVQRRRVRRKLRRRRRFIMRGAATVLIGIGVGIKLSRKDAEMIEQKTGIPAEELSEIELMQAMQELGISGIVLDEDDRVILSRAKAEEDEDRDHNTEFLDD